jgi:hypothetical protein
VVVLLRQRRPVVNMSRQYLYLCTSKARE